MNDWITGPVSGREGIPVTCIVIVMRQISGYKLWIGHAGDLRDPRAIFDVGIEAVVELADNEQLAILPRELVRLRFPLSDAGANPIWLIRLAIDSLVSLLRADIPTLVCCSNGQNRSVCIAAASLALFDRRPLDESLCFFAESGPTDISPGLLSKVREAMSD